MKLLILALLMLYGWGAFELGKVDGVSEAMYTTAKEYERG